MKSVGWIFLVTLVAMNLLVVGLPNTALAWLRSEIGWLGHSVNWVEALWPGWDTVHLLMFGVLGLVARLALPRVRLGRLLAGLAVFAAASEMLQYAVPGRTPRMSDFGQDLLGLAVGIALAMVLMFTTRIAARRRRPPSSG